VTRRILMTALAAGPDGVLRPGTAVDVPDAQAAELIAGGYAEDLAQPEAATEQPEETGTAGPGETGTAGPQEVRG
jgi:hypothetical protein